MADESEWTIYHNTHCGKSRKALDLLEDHDVVPRIVHYLKQPLDFVELGELCAMLKIEPAALLRLHEPLCMQLQLQRQSGPEILKAIAKYPVLMKRPIVVRGSIAVIAIPPEKVLELLDPKSI